MENFEDRYKKKSPFIVPDGYFDTLTDRITDRVDEEEKPQKIRFIQTLKPYLGLVAVFLLALMVVQVVLPRFIDKDKMLLKEGEQIVQTQPVALENEVVFDSQFDPTSEEIIEYLSSEVNSYELMYAGIY